MQPDAIDRYFEAHRERILSEWFELLRIPTVGTDPARLGDCARCTAWLRRYLKRLGFDTEVCLTPGQPVLLAERAGASDAPTVLFYGHYDVQPADPLELWHSPPFEPTLRDGRVYARGAQDNKGQFFAFLQGLRAQIEAGVRLPTLRLLLEGEEESGSRGLAAVLPAWRRRLQADLLMVCDTEMHASGRPAIVAGLRGMAHLTVEMNGPIRDLHSGTHGGLAPNPVLALARLLATLHAPDGRILVEGFMDRLRPPTPLEQELANAIPFDEVTYQEATGIAPVGGQAGVAAWERVGFQPTIEVNGLHGGYGGPGSKTVIPAMAMAKLSARLCPDQDARTCLEMIVAHLRRHCPPAFRLEIPESLASGGSLRLPVDSPLCRLATQVLTELDPRGPVFVWDGASLPIIAALREVTGAAPILVGFGQEADQIHAPDESYSLAQFRMTMLYAGRMLATLAGT